MPTPVSATRRQTVPFSCWAEREIRPSAGVNFTALFNRLSNTCRSFSSSPRTGGRFSGSATSRAALRFFVPSPCSARSSAMRGCRSRGASCRLLCSLSRRESSISSFTIAVMRSISLLMRRRKSLARFFSFRAPPASDSARIFTAASGPRNSWETLLTNSLRVVSNWRRRVRSCIVSNTLESPCSAKGVVITLR